MREITFDIETRSTAPVRGRLDINEMELIVVGVHDSETGEYVAYEREELPKLWPVLERADMLIGYNSDYFDIPLLNRYYPGDLTKIRAQTVSGRSCRAVAERLGVHCASTLKFVRRSLSAAS